MHGQPAPTSSNPDAATTTTTDAVFEHILKAIVAGEYPAGGRLPAERELARQLGASRPTLREALRRLTDWGIVEPKRGSGIVVKNRLDWSIEALPSYLRWATNDINHAQLIRDVLDMRRNLYLLVIRAISGRVTSEGIKRGRQALERAWSQRHQRDNFDMAELELIRALLEDADYLPGVWLFNRIKTVHHELTTLITHRENAQDGYLEAYDAFFSALEAHDGDGAARALETMLEEHDKRLLRELASIA